MRAPDHRTSSQISDGACHAQAAYLSARGKPKPGCRHFKQVRCLCLKVQLQLGQAWLKGSLVGLLVGQAERSGGCAGLSVSQAGLHGGWTWTFGIWKTGRLTRNDWNNIELLLGRPYTNIKCDWCTGSSVRSSVSMSSVKKRESTVVSLGLNLRDRKHTD